MYLVSCAVNSVKPDTERLRSMFLKDVLRMADANGLLSAAAFALEKVTELPHALDQAKKKAIRKAALFDIERVKILAEFEKHGIWYCPLKGIILKEYYPMLGMREMSDNDILCNPSRMTDIREIMEKQGYKCTSFGEFNHDVYAKPPTLEFEMHHALFQEDEVPLFAEYFSDIKSKLTGEGCGLRMTDADCYLYIICHMYKHYIHGGTGLRNLADIAVFKNHCDLKPLRAYLDSEFSKLGILGFEQKIRLLAENAMSGADLDESQEALLLKLAGLGIYGNYSTAEKNSIIRALDGDDRKRSKLKYYGRRVFPDIKSLKKQYPVVYPHKFLYPLLIVYRPIKGIFTHPKGIIKETIKIALFKK